ncbi:SpoIID/LytB domain-containing protein [Cyanobium sp. CH-040]|uniref:SpoIID/LytB domain-containing protein n=1 Tax=Cyanobium sp. CH-040 TaxID=2823708 RepID=UPI0020CD18C6|nr:SpoIID/LytB domain-containing protein [Cyanobium sp. CH-040]
MALSLRSWTPLLSLVAVTVPAVVVAGDPALQARQADQTVRVLLAEGTSLPLASLGQPLQLQPGGVQLPPGTSATLSLQGGRVRLAFQRASGPDPILLPPAAAYWLEPVPGSRADDAGVFQLQQRRYRGRLRVLASGGRLQAINHVPLESYLPSVVGSEMPASWPQAALRAQAVAARTYALRQLRPAADYDLKATVSSQVYKGLEAETASTREAVASTSGQVLMFGSNLANAVFHSSSGGLTENSGDIWQQQLPYLVSVPDFDHDSPVHQWQELLPADRLRQAFTETGGVYRIDVLATTATGRVRQARVVGPSGTLVVTGPQLRSRLGLRSTQVRFELLSPELAAAPGLRLPPPPVPTARPASALSGPAAAFAGEAAAGGASTDSPGPVQVPQPVLLAVGRGFGHGVGMSQWGAYAMARQGQSHERILSHYYRGTVLRPFGQR